MICSKCRNEMPEGAKFCNNCGADLSIKQFDTNDSDKNTQSINFKKEDTGQDSQQFIDQNNNQDNGQNNSNINQQPDNTKQPKKKKNIIIGIIVTIAILLGLAALGSSGDYSEEVSSVKNGHFEDYSSDNGYPNVGDAFENYFDDTSWKAFTSDGIDIVEFNGTFLYYDDETDCCLQFQTYDDGSFDIYAVEFNGIPQNKLIISALIDEVMDEAQFMN
ncbi:zinc ribbon domain-containing protein [Intestinibacter bartlettii]|uniref:Zinc ribbon domain-containing protein n=1 Tax=Intestinibacter bartlettii TaxID=261299 RepID=A0ABS6DX23_9FIRM|nr:zinc ribbon domain-containing protein [Intestinibacter bartlettii]MBU5336403.1 zinc ribbon domain-containing protein [Intestinibacter bartlettii]MDO5010736.1 zinc ribbon domain-containing protein [Intestinibacter bartlettii]